MADPVDVVRLLVRGGWTLDDAQARHRENPDTFWLPSEDELRALEVGHSARLIFAVADLADPIRDGIDPYSVDGTSNLVVSHERMWVWVERIEDDALVGVLQNLPVATHSNLVPGARVRFGLRDIIDLDLEPPVEMHEDIRAMTDTGFPILDEAVALGAVDPERTPAIAPNQLEVCRDAGVRPERPWYFARCLIDRAASDGVWPLYGVRFKPRADRDDSGWSLWSRHPNMEDVVAEHGFDVIHIGDVRKRCGPSWRFLALPPGWGFVSGPDGYEDVFFDPELLED